jgi:CRP/FNR family transcriptional regulator, cyclic AMP receptor protein
VPERDPTQASRTEDTGYYVRQSFEREYEAGEVIYEVGDESTVLYVLQAGQVELLRDGADGARTVSRHGPGEFFGEMGLLTGRRRTMRAVAASEARVLALDRVTLEAMCMERPEIGLRLIRRLVTRLTDLEQRLSALGADDMLRPVVRVLVQRAEMGGGGEGRVDTTLRQIANESGLTMLEAHRALGQLLERKRVRLQDDAVWIPDLEALSAALD